MDTDMKQKIAAALIGLTLIPATAQAQNIAVEAFAGVALGNTLTYDAVPYDMHSAPAFGAAVYFTGLGDFELGLDVLRTDRRYVGFVSGVETTSVMANGRYVFQIGQAASGYVGLGLGMIDVTYDGSTSFPAFTGSRWVTGGQVQLGGRIPVGKGHLFGELRYQTAFDDAVILDAAIPGAVIEYNSTNVLFGYRASF